MKITSVSGETPTHLILIDLSWVMYWFYYGWRKDILIVNGQPVFIGDVRGVTLLTKALVAQNPTAAIILVADSEITVLKEKFPFYKANRNSESKVVARVTVKRHQPTLLNFLASKPGIYFVKELETEADPLIFSIAQKIVKLPVTILANDMDIAQSLTRDSIRIISSFNIKAGIFVN